MQGILHGEHQVVFLSPASMLQDLSLRQMAVITGCYVNLIRSVKLIPWPGGHEVLFAATSDRLPSHLLKDGRATDSCFGLIGAHQCGVLMVDVG